MGIRNSLSQSFECVFVYFSRINPCAQTTSQPKIFSSVEGLADRPVSSVWEGPLSAPFANCADLGGEKCPPRLTDAIYMSLIANKVNIFFSVY